MKSAGCSLDNHVLRRYMGERQEQWPCFTQNEHCRPRGVIVQNVVATTADVVAPLPPISDNALTTV